jgi:hypothetical protein
MTSKPKLNVEALRGIPRDTTPEAYRVQCDALRQMSAETRGRLSAELIEWINQISADGVRRRHPEYSAEQARMAVIRMRLGGDLFRKAFPGVEVVP